MRSKAMTFSGVVLATFFIASCNKETEVPDETQGMNPEYFAGGTTTVFAAGTDAYTFPLANLSATNTTLHFEADGMFGQQFVTYGAPLFGGVGPVFNQNSCESCHIRNGRSQPMTSSDDTQSGLLLRLSVAGAGPHGEPLAVPAFGTQLQTKAIFGVIPEGKLMLSYMQEMITFGDGSEATLSKPLFSIVDEYTTLPAEVLTSARNAPPVFGLGLLAAIAEENILAREDINDSDGDGTSGKANWVWNPVTQQTELGRFGWKCGNSSAALQTAIAFNQDMGVTSAGYFPIESANEQSNCTTGFGNEPDITAEDVELTSFYFKTLAVPAPRNLENQMVKDGKEFFHEAGCASCHTPQQQTGSNELAELSNQTIYPYTDLLLHDMGEGLADNRPEFLADGNEWRTTPLWGIGLTQIVNPEARFLHDGRASTLEEAILWHGGEASAARDYYRSLSAGDREKLIRFLEAL